MMPTPSAPQGEVRTEVKLPSGSLLSIQIAPFVTAKALYQAMLTELKRIGITKDTEVSEMLKNVFCAAYSSPEIEAWLWECFKRCTIDGLKIDKDTFEPLKRREDYVVVCMEVGRANVNPFANFLYAEYKKFMAWMEGKSPESKSETTP